MILNLLFLDLVKTTALHIEKTFLTKLKGIFDKAEESRHFGNNEYKK